MLVGCGVGVWLEGLSLSVSAYYSTEPPCEELSSSIFNESAQSLISQGLQPAIIFVLLGFSGNLGLFQGVFLGLIHKNSRFRLDNPQLLERNSKTDTLCQRKLGSSSLLEPT